MNLRKNIMMIVSVMVAVIIALSVLVPVIQDSSASEDTFTNDGYFRMSKITTDADITILWDYTNPYVFNNNGVDVTIPFGSTNPPIYPYSIITADNWALRFMSTNNGVRIDMSIFGNSESLIWGVSSTASKNMTITLTGGVATFTLTGDSTSKTMGYTNAYVIDGNGDYTMKKSDKSAYVLADSAIYGVGRTGANFGGTDANFNAKINGTVNDMNASLIYPDWTVSNIVVNSDDVNGYEDLYTFDNVTFNVTDDSDNTVSANYGQIIVPYEVTAERSAHVSTIEASLLGIIPLLVVIGIVIGAVWFIRQKN